MEKIEKEIEITWKKTVPGWYGESERPDNGRDPSFLFPFHFHFPSTSFLTSSLFPFKRLVFFVIINQALLSFVSLLSGFTSRYWFDWQTINLIGPIKWCNIGLLFFFLSERSKEEQVMAWTKWPSKTSGLPFYRVFRHDSSIVSRSSMYRDELTLDATVRHERAPPDDPFFLLCFFFLVKQFSFG